MNVKQNLLPKSTIKRPMIKQVVKYITIHSTSNPKSTATNERAWLNNPSNKRQASWHYVVDEKEIIQAIPDYEIAYHAGDGQGNGNRASIGIELCESGNREKVLKQGAILVAKLLLEYELGLDKMVQHNYWNGKNCPRILREKQYIIKNMDWSYFKNLVKKEFAKLVKKQLLVKLPNGKFVNMEAVEIADTNYVGIRQILEALGFEVGFENGAVTVKNK